MEWYYSKNSTQLGPVTLDELKAKVNSGEVSANDLVWRDGMPDWTPAGKVAELAAAPALPTRESYNQNPTASAYPSTSPLPAPQTGLVVKIPNYLALSITFTLLSIFCCLALPFGIVSIVFGSKVNALVAAGRIDEARKASNTARLWLLIAVVVGVLYFATSLLMYSRLKSDPTFQEALEKARQIEQSNHPR